MGLGEPVSVARVHPVRNRQLLEINFPSEVLCVMLTLVQLSYKSNFEENVENTMIQKNNSRERKVLKPFSSLLLIDYYGFSSRESSLELRKVPPPLYPPVRHSVPQAKKAVK